MKLRYREEYSASVVLSWCTLWHFSGENLLLANKPLLHNGHESYWILQIMQTTRPLRRSSYDIFIICMGAPIGSDSMGARIHGQKGALAPPPSGNVVMCFCAVIFTAKRSDKLFIHYFHNQSSTRLLKLRPQTPPDIHPWAPLGDFCPHSAQTPNLPTPEKKSCGRPWVTNNSRKHISQYLHDQTKFYNIKLRPVVAGRIQFSERLTAVTFHKDSTCSSNSI